MKPEALLALLSLAAATGCDTATRLELPGSTEWDRNAVLAEVSEPVVEWLVAEGDRVEAGELLLRLESTRLDARLDETGARLAEAEARLAELRNGPRTETIASARANVDSAEAAELEADLDYDRASDLLGRGLVAEATVDQARAARDQRNAATRAARALLDELVAGTRREQLDQAEAVVARIRAERAELALTRDRLAVRAPRAGLVDALPFKPGDQPRAGDEIASLLVGDRPYARVFVPASQRAGFAIGDRFEISVEGAAGVFGATLRSIRGEASFTPYYALSGDDASRLVYRAELAFDDARAAALPAGLPLLATPIDAAAGSD
jgi:HlyD family secretion protein